MSLHYELKKKGNIDVTVLSPGVTKTPMSDEIMKRLGKSEPPFPSMTATAVAKEGLDGLGKKPVVIAGRKNRIMIFIMRRVLSTAKQISVFGRKIEEVYGF